MRPLMSSITSQTPANQPRIIAEAKKDPELARRRRKGKAALIKRQEKQAKLFADQKKLEAKGLAAAAAQRQAAPGKSTRAGRGQGKKAKVAVAEEEQDDDGEEEVEAIEELPPPYRNLRSTSSSKRSRSPLSDSNLVDANDDAPPPEPPVIEPSRKQRGVESKNRENNVVGAVGSR